MMMMTIVFDDWRTQLHTQTHIDTRKKKNYIQKHIVNEEFLALYQCRVIKSNLRH